MTQYHNAPELLASHAAMRAVLSNLLIGARTIRRGTMKGYVDLGHIKTWELDHLNELVLKAGQVQP